MKVGVYNLYWSTFGGGEQQAGGVADALSGDHEVELLGPEEIDLQVLRDRLGLRLEGVSFRRVADEYSATLASADYDLFINHTYRSAAPNLAPLGLYFVMFPHLFRASTVHRGARRLGAAAAAPVRVVAGVHPLRTDTGYSVEGPLLLHVQPQVRLLRVELDASEPEEIPVTVVRRGASLRDWQLDGRTAIEIDLAGEPDPHGNGFDVLLGAPPRRESTLRLTAISADGRDIAVAPRSLRQRLMPLRPDAFLDTYDTVVALSEYTLGWTKRWWGRGEAVLSPPVKMRSPGEKAQLIVAVGRFFDQRSGHSKQQLELVRAFRSLVDRGLDGWRFVLVGGCSPADREYAMAVRREARGLPVEVHLNAPGAFLDEQIAKATFLWHAAGLGADLQAHPDRAEHFGIAPIEAMSAGVVPLVFAAAGPTEVVQDGVSGVHFHSADELVRQTLELIADEPRRARLAAAAITRANEYDSAHFEDRVRELVAKVAGGHSPR